MHYCTYRIEESLEESALEELEEDSAVIHWVTPYSPVDAVYEVENGVTMDLEAWLQQC